jgi:[protein-PII] uridylyltransferase
VILGIGTKEYDEGPAANFVAGAPISLAFTGRDPVERDSLGRGRGRIESFRRYLRLETERLRMRHRLGLGGAAIARGLSDRVDVVVTEVCQVAAEGADARSALTECAIVALGGYGRRELAPYSDVDLLFLHTGRVSDGVRLFAERALHLLWDVGLNVGHGLRSARECVSLARTDLHARTSLTEARLLMGSASLFASLTQEVEAGLRGHRALQDFVALMRAELEERHTRWGRVVGLQEPNVKEGVGGLRDLHTVVWLGHALYGSRGLHELHREGWLGDADYAIARRTHDFLSRVRNEAHFVAGRRADLLTLDLQPELAKGLGYQVRGGLLASELFMRDYYRRTSELFHLATGFWLRHAPAAKPSRPRVRDGFEVQRGELFARGSSLRGGPLWALQCVAVAQAEGVKLSDSLRHAVRQRLRQVDVRFRTSRGTSRAFLRLFDLPGQAAPALRELHETGFLGRLIPEFARVTFLVQHDHFHRYTVDEHTLTAIAALDEVAQGAEGVPAAFGQVLAEVDNRTALYLGLLLHDIGKGRGSGHVARGVKIAKRVVRRLALDTRTAADVVFLVGAHLEMSRLSQRRDVTEPGVAEAFARQVGTLDRLNQLMLLTYADHRGVGPGIWNDWKASLLWTLYGRTRPHLPGGERRRRPRDERAALELARDALRAEFPADAIDSHFAQMPRRYLWTTDAGCMTRHFRMLQSLGDRPALVEWVDLEEGGVTELTVIALDRPGLFASVAGTLTAHGLDILSVDVFTRRDGRALDTFRVSKLQGHDPVLSQRRERIRQALWEAAAGQLDVEAALDRWRAKARRPRKLWGRAAKKPRVRFDLEASPAATVVEVRAPDQPGLAYLLAHTLSGLGLDIRFARIATEKALALDVFYVTDAEGRKLGAESRVDVEKALLSALKAKGKYEA